MSTAIYYHGCPAVYLGPTRFDDGREGTPHTRTINGKVRGYLGRSAIIPTCWCHGGLLMLGVRNDHITVVGDD